MSDLPALSVLMPAYNAARYLASAVESVLAQDFHDFELIVVNDGSTDGTQQLLGQWSGDRRLRVVRNESNFGLIGTLHRGLRECGAPLIARMDSDDICEPSRFSRQVAFLRGHPDVDIVGGAIRFFGNIPQPRTFVFPLAHEDIRPAMLFYCPLAHPALMFRRELVDKGLIRFDDGFRHAEDYHLWSRLLLSTKAANLPEPVLDYRLHAAQVSSSRSNHQYEASLKVRRLMLREAGVDFNDADIALHESVILEQPLERADYVQALAGWFAKLEAGNSATGYWQPEALHRLLRSKFLEASSRTGADIRALSRAAVTGRYVDGADKASDPALRPARNWRTRAKALLWRLRATLS